MDSGWVSSRSFPDLRSASLMTVSSPVRQRLGRLLEDSRSRREQRIERDLLRAELASFKTTSELSELSAIAARNDHADTSELRSVLSRQLAR
jgi:hypothetical protein